MPGAKKSSRCSKGAVWTCQVMPLTLRQAVYKADFIFSPFLHRSSKSPSSKGWCFSGLSLTCTQSYTCARTSKFPGVSELPKAFNLILHIFFYFNQRLVSPILIVFLGNLDIQQLPLIVSGQYSHRKGEFII